MTKVMFDRSVNFEGIRFRPREAKEIPDSSVESALAEGAWIVERGEKEETVTPPLSSKEEEAVEEPVEKVPLGEDFEGIDETDLRKMTKAELESIAQELGLVTVGLKKDEIRELIEAQV